MTETDILAIVAIVMSAASLGWQAVSWLRSGAVIQMALNCEDGTATVSVYNSGRVAATITSVYVLISPVLPGPERVVPIPKQESDPIPCPIPAGGHAIWHFPAKGVVERRARRGNLSSQCELHAWVNVGIRKSVFAQIDVYVDNDELDV